VANATNTGPSTIQLNGLSATRIIRRGGGDVLAGDLLQGYRTLLCFNAALQNFELYGLNFAGGQTGYLPILTKNTTLYVNGATGSDTLYDGSSATVVGVTAPKAGPFKTITKAMNTTFTYGPSVYIMTIQVAAGTYAEYVVTANVPGPGIVLNGVGPSTLVTGAQNHFTISCAGPNSLTVQNLAATDAITNTGGLTTTIFSSGGSANLTTNNVSTGNAVNFVYSSYPGGHIYIFNHTFQAGSSVGSAVMVSTNGSTINVGQIGNPATLTFSGSLTCSTFASSTENSVIEFIAPYVSFVNAGGVTGQKYTCSLNGVISTVNSGINYLPGSTAGATATGGQYS
jgi:hypothetical protein